MCNNIHNYIISESNKAELIKQTNALENSLNTLEKTFFEYLRHRPSEEERGDWAREVCGIFDEMLAAKDKLQYIAKNKTPERCH